MSDERWKWSNLDRTFSEIECGQRGELGGEKCFADFVPGPVCTLADATSTEDGSLVSLRSFNHTVGLTVNNKPSVDRPCGTQHK